MGAVDRCILGKIIPSVEEVELKGQAQQFFTQPGESMSGSWDRFTAFMRSIPNHCIDDDSLKEYFHQGKDDNRKAVLDTIVGGSYGE